VKGIGICHEESVEEQKATVKRSKVLCERLYLFDTGTCFASQRYLAAVVMGRRPILLVGLF